MTAQPPDPAPREGGIAVAINDGTVIGRILYQRDGFVGHKWRAILSEDLVSIILRLHLPWSIVKTGSSKREVSEWLVQQARKINAALAAALRAS